MIEMNFKIYNIKTEILNIHSTEEDFSSNINLMRICYSISKTIKTKENPEFYLSTYLGFIKTNMVTISFSKIKNENYRIQISESNTGNILLDLEIVEKYQLLNLVESIMNKEDFDWYLGTYKFEFTFKYIPVITTIKQIRPGQYKAYQEWIGK